MTETLVLDVSYQPIDRVSWERAFVLIFQGKVEVVEEYEDKRVRSATMEWKIPSVIRFLKYMGNRKKAIKFSRENVYSRDKGKCQYCNCDVKRMEITYDHVTPRANGGKTCWENVVISCFECNQCKKDRQTSCGHSTCRKCKGVKRPMKPLQTPVKPKNLPSTIRLTFVWRDGMPKSWQSYLYDLKYWHTSLDEG